jgi:hypothetical protein
MAVRTAALPAADPIVVIVLSSADACSHAPRLRRLLLLLSPIARPAL